MPVICFSMSTTRVCGPGYWSRSSTELQLYSPDGQSKQAWVSEMFYLSISHELSEIVSFHSLSELVMRTLAVILFTAQSNCQQISLLCCGIHIYMRSILYHSEWMFSFVLYQFVIKIWYLLVWLNMGYGSKEPVKEARRSLQTMDISNGSIWTSDIFSTHDKSLIWTIYIEILSP